MVAVLAFADLTVVHGLAGGNPECLAGEDVVVLMRPQVLAEERKVST
jgi:hypothetical protein